MNISNEIAGMILEILRTSHGSANIQRNELAARIGCVPSAINYVIASRFTQNQGYIVESRRGGGGYIRITEVCADRKDLIIMILNSLGDTVSEAQCRLITDDLLSRGIIGSEAARIINSAVSERTLSILSAEAREKVRAAVFKSALMSTM